VTTTTDRRAADIRSAAAAAADRVERAVVPDQPRDRRRDLPRPNGPRGPRVLRDFVGGGNPTDFFVDVARRWPDLAHLRIGSEHVYVLNEPSFIVDAMLTQGRQTMKGRGLQAATALLGAGLLTSEGDLHLRQRRLVQPAFHRDRIARYADTMTRLAAEHERTWVDGREVDLVTDMSALTLAVVGETLFGSDLSGDAAEVGAALTEVLDGFGSRLFLGRLLMRLPTPARSRALLATGRLDNLVQRIIDEHRAAGDTGDMLSMLIAAQEDGVGMDDAQLRDEAMTLVLAGHETTAMALSWSWLLLAHNPGPAQWLRAELDAVLAGRPATFADLAALPRTRAVVAESMRLYPPAWIMGRRALADLDVGGWTIPAGALVLASQYAMHRDPRFWDSALTFRPQRWLGADGAFDEAAPGQPRGAWFPFGWGNRRCIGDAFAWTEASLVLATLAQGWDPRPLPGHPVRPRPAVTLRPGGGLPAVLRRRSA
jgi:cytochrome P450